MHTTQQSHQHTSLLPRSCALIVPSAAYIFNVILCCVRLMSLTRLDQGTQRNACDSMHVDRLHFSERAYSEATANSCYPGAISSHMLEEACMVYVACRIMCIGGSSLFRERRTVEACWKEKLCRCLKGKSHSRRCWGRRNKERG